MSGDRILPTIKLIIFDNDGTLMDTEWAYTYAHEEMTGRKMTWDLKAKLMGKSSIESCTLVCNLYGLKETPVEFSERRTTLLDKCWDKIELMPGAQSLVSFFKERGIKMCIATASRRHVFNQKVSSQQEFISNMDSIVTGDEVERGKPCPDIFLKALGHFEGILPSEVLVFEDSSLGIKAANSAGMYSVYIPDSHIDIEQSLKDQDACPTQIISSLELFDRASFNFQ